MIEYDVKIVIVIEVIHFLKAQPVFTVTYCKVTNYDVLFYYLPVLIVISSTFVIGFTVGILYKVSLSS